MLYGFPFGVLKALQRQFKGTECFHFKGAVPREAQAGLELGYSVGDAAVIEANGVFTGKELL